MGGFLGRGDHVVDPEDEDVVRVIFAVDAALNAELRERRRAHSPGIVLVGVVDRTLNVNLRAAEFREVDTREGDLLNEGVDILAFVLEGNGRGFVYLLDL